MCKNLGEPMSDAASDVTEICKLIISSEQLAPLLETCTKYIVVLCNDNDATVEPQL